MSWLHFSLFGKLLSKKKLLEVSKTRFLIEGFGFEYEKAEEKEEEEVNKSSERAAT